jgi:hypothetical protein
MRAQWLNLFFLTTVAMTVSERSALPRAVIDIEGEIRNKKSGVPGVAGTYLWGINESGQVVGNSYHGALLPSLRIGYAPTQTMLQLCQPADHLPDGVTCRRRGVNCLCH